MAFNNASLGNVALFLLFKKLLCIKIYMWKIVIFQQRLGNTVFHKPTKFNKLYEEVKSRMLSLK